MALESASLTALRVFREVVDRGTLTAAATALGYTQSAVSRQVAGLERAVGTPLLDRHRTGVRPSALRVALPADDPLARLAVVDLDDLRGHAWIAGPVGSGAMGVWPGLDERPRVAHTARDWLAKLALVAGGHGITTVPAGLVGTLPTGVVALPVRGGPVEDRRVVLARVPGPVNPAVERVAAALREAAATP